MLNVLLPSTLFLVYDAIQQKKVAAAFTIQKGGGWKGDLRPVKAISDDARGEPLCCVSLHKVLGGSDDRRPIKVKRGNPRHESAAEEEAVSAMVPLSLVKDPSLPATCLLRSH